MTTDRIIADLERAIAQLEAEREQVCRQYDARIKVLRAAMGAVDTGTPVTPDLSVGIERLDAVRAYVSKEGRVRQADIGKVLGMNSGSVSCALRLLHAQEAISPGPKERGSRVWEAQEAAGAQAEAPAPLSGVGGSSRNLRNSGRLGD